MKRKREFETKSEIKSAIEELSLLVKLIHRTNNDDNNYDKKAQSPAPVATAATATTGAGVTTATAAAAAETVGAQTSADHLKRQNPKEMVVLNIPTRPFLSFCSIILQILDKIGPTMVVLRHDINKNIQRLEMLCDCDSTKYSNLVEILKKEAVERNAKKGDSCSKALVWLTRSLDFTAALLQKLLVEPRESMELIVGNSYETTLKPWHGWISTAAYKVALKLVPETDTFISLLMEKGESIDTFRDEIQTFISLLMPLLEDLHSTLISYGLAKLKST